MKKFSTLFIFLIFFVSTNAWGDQPKSIGKYKNWEAFTYKGDKGKIALHKQHHWKDRQKV